VVGATGHEVVTAANGEPVTQNPKPVSTNSLGQVFDLVSRGPLTETRVDRKIAIETFDANTQNAVDLTTRMTLTLKLPKNGSIEIVFDRRLTNVDENGKIRLAGPRMTGPAPNYTITIGPITVNRLR